MDCDLAGKENISMNPTVKEYLIDAWDKYRAQKGKRTKLRNLKIVGEKKYTRKSY
jgi:hypothetical protein